MRLRTLNFHFVTTLIVAVSSSGTALAATKKARAGATSPIASLEAAPLRSLVGELDLRAEVALPWGLALGTRVENSDGPSERDSFRDRRRSLGFEGLWYPLAVAQRAVFVAAGARREEAVTGRQAPRDTNTWARTNSDEMNDRWTSAETSWAATQALGVRLFFGGFATASLRLERDELVTRTAKIDPDQVKSYDPDLTTAGRPRVRTGLALHAGVFLP